MLSDRARMEVDLGRIDSMRSLVTSLVKAAEARNTAVEPAVSRERLGYVLAIGAMLAVVLVAALLAAIAVIEQADRRVRTRSQVERVTGLGSVKAILARDDGDVAVLGAVVRQVVGPELVDAVLVPVGELSTIGLAERLGRRLANDGGPPARVTSAPSLIDHSAEALDAIRGAQHVFLVVESGRSTIEDTEFAFKTLQAIGSEPHAVVVDGVLPRALAAASR